MAAAQEDLTSTVLIASDAGKHRNSLFMEATRHFASDPGTIKSIMPCTPFQRDVMDWTAHDKRRAVGHVIYEIPENVDIERLFAAWKEVVR